ncbi:MAG: dockerin type I domain-containing protein [Oscillospiraceae bacterium]|nr:dockerin type I domain-containing protein [Oscillospiraceae bacterium]
MKKRILSTIIAAAVIFSLSAWLTIITRASDTYPTPAGFNDNDYQKLVSFALQDDNLTKLGWTLDDLATWTGITWTSWTYDESEIRVSDIHLYSKQLSGKLDVSDFTALIYLEAPLNQLTELDVSNNTNLFRLLLVNNQLTELDVSSNTELRQLYVINNQLTELDVSSNTELMTLDVLNNQLTELDVSKNTALMSLNVTINQLSELDVSKNTALTNLWAWDNQLSELDVSKNTALRGLNVTSNQLTELDVSKNTLLEKLTATNNQLSELDVSKNTRLTELDCSDNQLTDISSFEDLENLIFVDVRNNFLDLNSEPVKASITKIQATVDKNGGTFEYSPQNTINEPDESNTLDNVIENALKGDNPRIVLDEDTGSVISEDALDMIKDSDKVVEIELESGLVITIDPDSITNNAKAIDLNIEIALTSTGNQIPGVPANTLAITPPPTTHGEFGFTISFNITEEELLNAGINGNASVKLYYGNADGTFTDMNQNIKRNPDGSITVSISKFSFYVLSELNLDTTKPENNNNGGNNYNPGNYVPSVRPPSAISRVPTAATSTTTQIKGDINGDGVLNASDALAILKHVSGVEKLEGDALEAADVNGDGVVNASDALEVLKLVAGA